MGTIDNEAGEAKLRSCGIELIGGIKIFYQQTCAPVSMPGEEVARLVELYCPSGTSYGWHFKDEPLPSGDAPMVTCADNPNRRHVILWA